tara:strand:+ start:8287 stop:9060 length:774 start_codon:yes stop_codon:yes gene_type:complete
VTVPASPRDLLDLSGRVLVVTGAGGGIGSGIVNRLVATGAKVVAHTRSSSTDHLFDLDGNPVSSLRADLTSPDGPAYVVDSTLEKFGRLDGLVNNAGTQSVVPFNEITDEIWSQTMDINLTAVHRLTHLASTAMRSRGSGGSIVHIASIEAHHPTEVHGHYATSKAALVMLARAAALSYGRSGIRVNTVSPGLITRPGLDEDWPDGVERWKEAAPLTRLGTPDDVGDACVFLCSDLSRWITGIDLVVDGGILTRPTW